MPVISFDAVTKVYPLPAGDVVALAGIDLAIEEGEFVLVMGPSGSGKSTLLNVMGSLDVPTSGEVTIAGKRISRMDDDELTLMRRDHIGFIFQQFNLIPLLSVVENVEYPLILKGRRDVSRERAEEVLAAVGITESHFTHKPGELSGGQQQRVALARALAAEGECLLLDEPLSNLDARLRLHMRGELRRLVKETGVTAVYVTHDQKEALSMADRVAVMNEGRIVQVGPPEEIYNRPANRFVADFLGEANFVSGQVAGLSDSGLVKVETPVGTLLADPTAAVVQAGRGAAVTCCMRPERVQVLAAGGPAPDREKSNVLAAKVDSSTYLGEMRQYVLKLGSSTHWKALMLAGHLGSLPGGQDVRLAVHSADVSLLME